MPYVTNIGIKPSEDLPTYAGFFRNQGPRGNDFFHGSWVMRFADKKYYSMVPMYRKKGVIPLDKNGRIPQRCSKGKASGVKCNAKSLLEVNPGAMKAIEERNYEWLRLNPDSMKIIPKVSPPHTCGCHLPFYYADRCAVTEDFRREKIESPAGAWARIVRKWTSNFGLMCTIRSKYIKYFMLFSLFKENWFY